MKIKAILLALLLISLSSCRSRANIPNPTPTATDTPRWMMYEAALLKATVRKDDGVCEWVIMGTSDKEVYVYADCKLRGPIGTAMSVPAVIYLGEYGEIVKVTIPRDGVFYPEDVRALFPPDIQTKIFAHDTGGILDMEYLQARMNQGGPPLIVVLGTPMP